MTQLTIGDLAQSFQFRRQSGELSNELSRLAQELTTGRTANVRAALRGDTAGLAAIERSITRIDSFELAIKDSTLEVSTRQSTVDTIRLTTQETLGTLLLDETFADPLLSLTAAREGAQGFNSILKSLNGVIGNRALFAGTSTDGPAVVEDDTILTAIEAEITLAGVTEPTDVEALIETWFAPGGGFDTIGYVGGANSVSGPQLSDSETLGRAPRADDVRIRDTLVGFAMAALVDRGLFMDQPDDTSEFLRSAGERMLNAERGLSDLQGEIGLDEARIDRAAAEGAAQRISLVAARAALIDVDPYETAGELQSVEVQIQSLFTVTARLSQLTLTAFLT